MRYRARWILPGDSAAVADGTLIVEEDLIEGISHGREPAAEDLGNVAIIPGLVNAHVHLEFSDLAEPLPTAEPFAEWIRALVAHRRQRNRPASEIVRAGCRESAAAGVTSLGEIATEGWSAEAFRGEGQPGVTVYRELLGLPAEAIEPQLQIARQHLAGSSQKEGLRYGLSPHAPYSVHPELFHAVIDLAVLSKSPVAMHLAETRDELELLQHGTGLLVEMLRGFGVWREGVLDSGGRPLDYLRRLAEVEHALVIHGNYLDDEELDFLAKHPQLAVVYCPRTHRYFGHEPHPWRTMLDRGVRLAIGTDGRGSNPDLSLLAELQLLRLLAPELPAQTILELGTRRGALALGRHDVGCLEPGMRADCAVVDLQQVTASDAYEAILDPRARVVGTLRAGRWL